MKMLAMILSVLCFTQFILQANANEVLQLKKLGKVKFTNVSCEDQTRKCLVDVESLRSQEVVAERVQTSIYLLNVINNYRSNGIGGDIFLKEKTVLAASVADFLQRIVFDDYTTLIEARFSIIGPTNEINTALFQRILSLPEYKVFALTHSHKGDEQTHKICQEDPVDCYEYVDKSYTTTTALRINPLLNNGWNCAGESDCVPQFYVINGKAIEAVLSRDQKTLTVVK